MRPVAALILLLATSGTSLHPASTYMVSTQQPPAVMREFRGAWVASVGNIDWPSQRGLTTEQQKSELITILDRAAALKLNAILLQVRPASDALYASTLEPWSEYLTGEQGRGPVPSYDPLAFAVGEAHRRGIELHAWFNPFRARHASGKSTAAANHITRKQPQLVRTYGKLLWLDPGEAAVQEHVTRVILDVVNRYDVDGVHLDDYFYPYPEKNSSGAWMNFPDDGTFRRYAGAGGKLTRDDWRRENVNVFVHRLYSAVKGLKPWVKVGISPFGIWRSGVPEGTRGLDAYDKLYADSRRWLAGGWLDYCAPQLYWTIDSDGQSFPTLLRWWAAQNTAHRHLWPGLSTSGIGTNRRAQEILDQIRVTRAQVGAGGEIHWSMKPLLQNRDGIGDRLQKEAYAQPALVPASPWLDKEAPARPQLSLGTDAGGNFVILWSAGDAEKPWLWVVQTKFGNAWRTDVFAAHQSAASFKSGTQPDVIAVSAVDRVGNASAPAMAEKQRVP